MPAARPRTIIDKIWDAHVISEQNGETLLYVDRHLLHDGSFHAFDALKAEGRKVHRPAQAIATPDHYVPTTGRRHGIPVADYRNLVEGLVANTAAAGITHFGMDDPRQGIVHIVGPEQGFTQPGIVLVCGDSHTSTHGAMGAFAFGIGASEVKHVLATQSIWQRRPKTMRIEVEGRLPEGLGGKDVILAVIGQITAAGASGHAVEYAGSAIRALSMEGRLTVCNMSIEAGARAGLIAPDDTTFQYLAGRPYAPKGAAWDAALGFWKTLPTDDGAEYARTVTVDVGDLRPMLTWGTSPEDAAPIDGRVPDPSAIADPVRRESKTRALQYMGLTPGTPLAEIEVDRVFIGSCTNGRIEDLRAAAAVARGRKAKVPTLVVPGSGLVRDQAVAEGLDRIFTEAGFEWREPGCSMCVGMNGDTIAAGMRSASTSNRNFEGRQGKGARTHLMSPAMAAAAAVTGRFTDFRRLGPA
ncbi:3-isopropylmalate dehydratase large subunit [Stella sp.]|uniref:3-isopropylmalate dehydratase large subunit n=1 Tax=Stella sp. TaxID=2912054 RepID=UPI0035AF08D5